MFIFKTMEENKILDEIKIKNATRRIAYQVYESNINLKEIYLVGISSNGVLLSKRIGDVLKNIGKLKIHQIELIIDKKKPRKGTIISIDIKKLENKSIIVIDDKLQ